jgi:hypothetical protein
MYKAIPGMVVWHCQLNGRHPDFLKFPLTLLYEKSGVEHVNSQVFYQFIGGFLMKLPRPLASCLQYLHQQGLAFLGRCQTRELLAGLRLRWR